MREYIVEGLLTRFVVGTYSFYDNGNAHVSISSEYYESMTFNEFEGWMLDIMYSCAAENIESMDYPITDTASGTVLNNKPLTTKCLEHALNIGGQMAKNYLLTVPAVLSEQYNGFSVRGSSEYAVTDNSRSQAQTPTNRVMFYPTSVHRSDKRMSLIRKAQMSLRCGCFI